MKTNNKLFLLALLSFGSFQIIPGDSVDIQIINKVNDHHIINRHYKNGSWSTWSQKNPVKNNKFSLSTSKNTEYAYAEGNFDKGKSTQKYTHKGTAFKGMYYWDVGDNTIGDKAGFDKKRLAEKAKKNKK